jgi:hypothetical protein
MFVDSLVGESGKSSARLLRRSVRTPANTLIRALIRYTRARSVGVNLAVTYSYEFRM